MTRQQTFLLLIQNYLTNQLQSMPGVYVNDLHQIINFLSDIIFAYKLGLV